MQGDARVSKKRNYTPILHKKCLFVKAIKHSGQHPQESKPFCKNNLPEKDLKLKKDLKKYRLTCKGRNLLHGLLRDLKFKPFLSFHYDFLNEVFCLIRGFIFQISSYTVPTLKFSFMGGDCFDMHEK